MLIGVSMGSATAKPKMLIGTSLRQNLWSASTGQSALPTSQPPAGVPTATARPRAAGRAGGIFSDPRTTSSGGWGKSGATALPSKHTRLGSRGAGCSKTVDHPGNSSRER